MYLRYSPMCCRIRCKSRISFEESLRCARSMFMVRFAIVRIVPALMSATRRCRLSSIVYVNFSMSLRFAGDLAHPRYISVFRMTFMEATGAIASKLSKVSSPLANLC